MKGLSAEISVMKIKNKFNTNRKYFFILDPYVYFLKKLKSVFFYNTLTKKHMESDNKNIYDFLKDIQEGKNLSVKVIYEKDFKKKKGLKEFLLKLREGFFGDLVELEEGEEPPIQLYPILGLKRTETGEFDFTGEQNTLDYLKNINIFLNENCGLNCDYCSSAYKQFSCCGKSGKNSMDLDYKNLSEIIKYLKEYPNVTLSFSGGNIFNYKKLENLINLLKSTKNKKSFFVHYVSIFNNLDKIQAFDNTNILINVLVDFSDNSDMIKKIKLEIEKSDIDLKFIFIVQNESDLEQFMVIIDKYKIKNYSIRPFYNGKNKTFFKSNVYFNKTQIIDQDLSIKDIFFNQVFNKHFLGTANILNNGDYFINLNKKRVGNIKKDSINDIVNNELVKNGDWFLTRNKVKPCKSCSLRFLCPAISNYEFNLGKFDLCRLNKKDKNIKTE